MARNSVASWDDSLVGNSVALWDYNLVDTMEKRLVYVKVAMKGICEVDSKAAMMDE